MHLLFNSASLYNESMPMKRKQSKNYVTVCYVYFPPTLVSTHWRYRFFDVQFSSDVANVQIGLTICNSLCINMNSATRTTNYYYNYYY